MKVKTIILPILLISINACTQNRNLPEMMGFKADAKLLIIHADDAGLSHATNQAVEDAFKKGGISSSSILVTAPSFQEIVNFSMDNPEFDFGIHLAFTSEWHTYKWKGITPSELIPSLTDSSGYLYAATNEVVENMMPGEIEAEARAQLDKAILAGLKPSHVDSHMGVLFSAPELFSLYVKIGREYKLPVFVPIGYSDLLDSLRSLPENSECLSIRTYSASPDIDPEGWNDFYLSSLRSLQPGLNIFIIHLAYDTDETRSITNGHDYWDAAWRQRDTDFFMQDQLQQVLAEENIKVISWKEVKQVLYPE
jgi:hypothetical protein